MPSSVDLARELEKFVSALIKSGRYNSKSEVLREGVPIGSRRIVRPAPSPSWTSFAADAQH